MEDQIRLLNRKRGTVKSKLTSFRKFVESIERKIDEKSINELERETVLELEIRLEKICSLNTEFDEIQTEIELICLDNDLDSRGSNG